MLIDARETDSSALQDGPLVQADVCVVGAGAAGITIALELAEAGHEVVLLESGGLEFDQQIQKLYAGTAGGTFLPVDELYLSRSRVRRFGGSTNHWNGWCRPLDREDFERRDWIEHSGWPINRSDLEPFYQRAAPYLDIGAMVEEGPRFLENDPHYESVYFLISAPTRFGLKYRQALADTPRVRVLLHANLVELRAGEDGTRADRVVAATLDGTRFEVVAQQFVLACGGVENARLLLASNRMSSGVRTSSPALGRYFMDHPIRRVGRVTIAHGRRGRMLHFYDRERPAEPGKIRAVVRPTGAVERDRRWGRSLFVFDEEGWWHGGDFARSVGKAGVDFARIAEVPGQVHEGPYFGSVNAVVEQRPNPASRVTLTDEHDALGVPRVELDWRLTTDDERTLGEAVEGFQRRLGANFEGRMQNRFRADDPWRNAGGSNHHMGTTRMGTVIAESVVDPSCRVHGIHNLHVAGSSVFPTCGAANPTYTLVALAIRLADHLDGLLSRRAA